MRNWEGKIGGRGKKNKEKKRPRKKGISVLNGSIYHYLVYSPHQPPILCAFH